MAYESNVGNQFTFPYNVPFVLYGGEIIFVDIDRWTVLKGSRMYNSIMMNVRPILDVYVVFAQEWNFRMVVRVVVVEEVEVDVVLGIYFI